MENIYSNCMYEYLKKNLHKTPVLAHEDEREMYADSGEMKIDVGVSEKRSSRIDDGLLGRLCLV